MPSPRPDPRYRQSDKEALLTLGLYVLFFLWWTLFAFGLGSGDPAAYSTTFGMPDWFFYSCVAGYPLLTLVLWLVVHFGFRHMSLDTPPGDLSAPPANGAAKPQGSPLPPHEGMLS